MSYFSTHVYDAGHITSSTTTVIAEGLSTVVEYSTFGLYDDAFTWDDDGLSIFGSKAGMNIYGGSLGQGLYSFGNFMNRDLPNFLKSPADSLSANEEGDGSLNQFRKNWKNYWGDVANKRTDYMRDLNDKYHDLINPEIPFQNLGDAATSEGGDDPSVKGPGKMRGRDPEMAFNEGVKGYGRGSLKIGRGGGGGGSRIGGKFDTYRTGRYTMPD